MERILILGGDERQRYLANELRKRGFLTAVIGLSGEDPVPDDALSDALQSAETVVLPVPATRDGQTVSGVRTEKGAFPFRALADLISPNARILGGAVPEEWVRNAEERNRVLIDYYDSAFQLRNALPTAEGAIRLAMELLPVTLYGTRFAILGGGRIAGLLCERLLALGAKGTVLARDPQARIRFGFAGADAYPVTDDGFRAIPPDCRLLFNTVPSRILTEDRLALLPKACILIELASAPGGFDLPEAEATGFRVVPAGGLPGRFYPESAGEILAQAILERLGET